MVSFLKEKALLKLRVVIGGLAALPLRPGGSSRFLFPQASCPGTGFYLGIFLIQSAGFLYWKIKTKRKRARGRRRLEDPAGR
jgi:hypothetical protein